MISHFISSLFFPKKQKNRTTNKASLGRRNDVRLWGRPASTEKTRPTLFETSSGGLLQGYLKVLIKAYNFSSEISTHSTNTYSVPPLGWAKCWGNSARQKRRKGRKLWPYEVSIPELSTNLASSNFYYQALISFKKEWTQRIENHRSIWDHRSHIHGTLIYDAVTNHMVQWHKAMGSINLPDMAPLPCLHSNKTKININAQGNSY